MESHPGGEGLLGKDRGGRDQLLLGLTPPVHHLPSSCPGKRKWGCLEKLQLLAGLLFHNRKYKWSGIAEKKNIVFLDSPLKSSVSGEERVGRGASGAQVGEGDTRVNIF